MRHRGRGLRVEHDTAAVAGDHGRVRIALGGEGVEIGADLGEGDLLLRKIRGGRKTLRNLLGHQIQSSFSYCYYCCCCCCCRPASSIRRLASSIASRNTSRSPM